jgi:hypothetical protein
MARPISAIRSGRIIRIAFTVSARREQVCHPISGMVAGSFFSLAEVFTPSVKRKRDDLGGRPL